MAPDPSIWHRRHALDKRRREAERKAGVVARKPTVKNGYAAPPGTGPEGKTCKDCAHKQRLGNYGGKSFLKCELRRATWTHGEGTDILARSPACSKFVPQEPSRPGEGE